MAATGTVGRVHPIEWLRAIARSEDVPHVELASEAAAALAALADDPLGMVPACRRLLDRHPEVGPLWWACARMLAADDARTEARAIQNDLAADQVGLSLALDLPSDLDVALVAWSPLAVELADRRPDLAIELVDDGAGDFAERNGPDGDASGSRPSQVLLVEAWAAGEAAFLVPEGVKNGVAAARRCGTEAWLLVGVGRRLPEPLFKALRRRVSASTDAWLTGADLLTAADVARVVEPLSITGPCPPELL